LFPIWIRGGTVETIVLIKEVLDPDLPTSKFAVDAKNMRVIPPEGIPAVVSPYDAVAVEAALRIKEEVGGNITVVSLGEPSCEAIVRKALAMGADAGIIVSDPSFNTVTNLNTAFVLAQTIRKIGAYDLILCGRQAADWDRGVTGPMIAEYLGIPVATLAKSISMLDNRIRVERVTANGSETLEMALPAVVTVSNELGQPRIPSGWGVIRAVKVQIPQWGAKDIPAENIPLGPGSASGELLNLYAATYDRKCEFVIGEEMGQLADGLIRKIHEVETARN
jgi:electron transfer flavoprotein beta subunit